MHKVIKVLICIICVTLAVASCYGQHLTASMTAEKTIAGCEYGTSLAFQTKRLVSIGTFYQTGIPKATETFAQAKTFYGAYLALPLLRAERINFFVQSRVGLVSEKFIAVVPGVETELRIAGKLWISFGSALRMTYPSFTSKISFKL
jgi:hypothetical protein